MAGLSPNRNRFPKPDSDITGLNFGSTDIEGDSMPLPKKELFRPMDTSDGTHREKRTKYLGRVQKETYDDDTNDSITSTDSGISSIRSKSTIPSVTYSSGIPSVTSSNASSFSRSTDGSNLLSQLSDLKLSESDTRPKVRSTSSNILSRTDNVFDTKQSERLLDEGLSSSEPQDHGYFKKEDYFEGLKLTDEALKVNQDGDMSLHLAIIYTNAEVALILISLLPVKYLDHSNNLLQTPLHLSALTQQPRITRALVMAGASLEAPDRNGNTALHLATINNYLDCVGALTHRVTVAEFTEYLGDKRSLQLPQTPQSLELKNYEGYTCSHIATFNGNLELLAYLVHLGGNINAADNKSGRRPLHYAVESGNVDLATFIVKRLGANVHTTTFDLNTPMHVAAGRDLHQLVSLLLESGASRHAVNCEGLTPYMVAKSDKMKAALQTVEYSDFTITGI